jgi:hypothetical protein
VLTIKRAKALQGTFSLPPSPDLFLCAAFAALAVNRSMTIASLKPTPLLTRLSTLLTGFFELAWTENGCSLTICPETRPGAFHFDDDQLPYRDLIVFLALSSRVPVLFGKITEQRLAFWQEQASRIGYTLEPVQNGERRGLVLAGETVIGADIPHLQEQDIHAALGLFWGLRAKRSFQIDFTLSSPFRHLIQAFGFELGVKRDLGEAEKDPLVRRMKIQLRQRLSSQEQLFTVTADFSKAMPEEPVAIDLPGDEVLLGQLLTAKSLLHKGSFIIDNAPLEPWAFPVLTLMRKMGSRPSLQESRITAFGGCGMITVQRFDLTGQKTDFSPQPQYAFHLPAMALLCSFAEGESVFRKFDDVRRSDPDTIHQLETCLTIMQVKFGDIPDGFVIKGSPEYDGFDLPEPLGAHITGAFALAGHCCVGSTTVHDAAILERWPEFNTIIENYFEYRT